MKSVDGALFLCSLFILLAACGRTDERQVLTSSEDRMRLRSEVGAISGTDSLEVCLDRWQREGDAFRVYLAGEELGRRYRNSSKFKESIASYETSLEAARQLDDTLCMVSALNNLGTDFRRLGMLAEASSYHFSALNLVDLCSGSSFDARKSRVVSLNGIGNIYLTLGNLDSAESTFREALAGEKSLDSDLGQAINYANIGAVLEAKGQYDSAYFYYNESLEHNRLAGSELGVSLCYNHLGRLSENAGDLDAALAEYERAYSTMESSSDRWHWLESCISISRVLIRQGRYQEARAHMDEAMRTAVEIDSKEHIAAVYELKYEYYRRTGDYRRALDSYVLSKEWADSVSNDESVSYLQNLQVDYVRNKRAAELDKALMDASAANRDKRTILVVSIALLVLSFLALAVLCYALKMRQRAYDALRRMEDLRQTFFTNLTHEFRTPLTIILGLSEHLRNEDTDAEERRKCLQSIENQGNSLLSLVNRLLDLAKFSSGFTAVKWCHGNVALHLGMCLESYRDYAASKDISLRFDSPSEDVEADFPPETLEHIVGNLMSNALKFTPKGGRIELSLSAGDDSLRMRFFNSGSSIPEADLPHIFDVFRQGANAEGTAFAGTGIGLAYCRQILSAVGGSIKAKNLDDGVEFEICMKRRHDGPSEDWVPGSVMKAELPPADALAPAADGESAAAPDEDGRPAVLVVDDNSEIASYLGVLLGKEYRVYSSSNAADGLAKAREVMPDVILTDLMMPGVDGFEFCARVRADAAISHIPILVISAKVATGDRVKALKVGAEGYLSKPFDTEELKARISGLLEQRRILREKFSQALSRGEEVEAEAPLSRADRELLNNLGDYLRVHLADKDLDSRLVAASVGMSRPQLDRKLKALTGLSITTYLIRLKMERASRILASSTKSVSEVALACGFEDTSYFSRVFKQTFGVTPTQYRGNLDKLKN